MDERTQTLLESAEPRDRVDGLRLVVLFEDQDAAGHAERLLDRDPEAEVREHAARAVGVARGGDAVEQLARVGADDADPIVRRTALAILGELGEKRAAAALVPLLGRGGPQDRGTAIEALRACGDPATAPALASVAGDPDVRLQVIALHAFAALASDHAPGRAAFAPAASAVRAEGPLWALPAVLLLSGEDVTAAFEAQAARASARDLERAVLRALELPESVGTRVLGVLVGIGGEGEALAARLAAARELARRGDPRGCPTLARAVYRGEPAQQLDAACALAELAVSVGENLLLGSLERASAPDRPRVARALALLARPEGVKALGALLSGDVPSDRRAAALAFAALGRRDGVLELVRALDFPYRRERVEALRALQKLWPAGPEVPALAGRGERAAAVRVWEEHFAR